jgi:hypothetical protein
MLGGYSFSFFGTWPVVLGPFQVDSLGPLTPVLLDLFFSALTLPLPYLRVSSQSLLDTVLQGHTKVE